MIARDTTGKGSTPGGSLALSWTHTMSSSFGGLVFVQIGVQDNTDHLPITPTSITFGGVTMSLIDNLTAGSGNNTQQILYFLKTPPTGAQTVSITWTNTPTNVSGVSTSYIGVDPTFSPDDQSSQHTVGTEVGPLNATSKVNNAWVVLFTEVYNNQSQTAGANTNRIDNENGAYVWDTNGPISPPGTTAQSVTWVSSVSFVAMQCLIYPPVWGGAFLLTMI